MAKVTPVIPDDKVMFFKNKLYREIQQLFEWTGLPEELPYDYMEYSLTHDGRVMFFKDEKFGHMALACYTEGINVYGKPTRARSIRLGTEEDLFDVERMIVHRYDETMPTEKACVLIENMYGGESMESIIDFYARRLALLQQAFDTNALWQNLPPIFTTNTEAMKLSIEKMFSDIMTGQPWIVMDKEMLNGSTGIPVEFIAIQSRLADLFDAMNEVYSAFKETVGINSPGADKKERLLKDEVNSNNQSIQTCAEIMLSSRKIACEEIKKVFGLDITVDIRGKKEMEEQAEEAKEEMINGNRDNGAANGPKSGSV